MRAEQLIAHQRAGSLARRAKPEIDKRAEHQKRDPTCRYRNAVRAEHHVPAHHRVYLLASCATGAEGAPAVRISGTHAQPSSTRRPRVEGLISPRKRTPTPGGGIGVRTMRRWRVTRARGTGTLAIKPNPGAFWRTILACLSQRRDALNDKSPPGEQTMDASHIGPIRACPCSCPCLRGRD